QYQNPIWHQLRIFSPSSDESLGSRSDLYEHCNQRHPLSPSIILSLQLGVVEAAPQRGENPPTVLISLLITGLLLAAALIGGYCLKNHCGHNAKGMRLAEEAYPVDEENQGNTLVSVAPLNPPETLEKPANGDSQEAAKTQPPPTNGHSTPKTADTEL
uniref:Uncharacterized protein n=1 Tax=Esox lucius TaxID=8010 RepID=A0A6Q2Y7M4_ESOLU